MLNKNSMQPGLVTSFCLLIGLCFHTMPCFSQSLIEKDVDQYVMSEMQKTFTPGIAIGVTKNGRTVFSKGYGLINVELAVFTDANSVFQLLSITKQFTAAGIMVLEEKGRISLDEKITTYLKQLPGSWKEITVTNLLNHTSGLVDYTDVHPFFEQIREEASPEELLRPLYTLPLQFRPGSQWRYSNSNYYLLGLLIQQISGESIGQFLEENIFSPLGMRSTRFNNINDVIPYRVAGYHWMGDEADKEPAMVTGFHGIKHVLQNSIYISPSRQWAAGAIVSSVADLIKWDSALTNHLILSRRSIEQVVAPGILTGGTAISYGMGNELFSIKKHRVAGHQGGGMAFNTTYLRFLDDSVSVIVLCNQTTGPSKRIALHIASMLIPDLDYDKARRTYSGDTSGVTVLFKKVLENARLGQVDFKQFAPEAQQTAEFISRVGPEFLKKQGPLRSVELIDQNKENNKCTYTFKTVFDHGVIIWNFSLNNKQEVLELRPQTD